MLMHSLDTVKTRQQGDPHLPPKYTSLGSSYFKIWRQEGIRRGLYAGWLPALLGSFPGTVIFFGTYEFSKRHMLDYGVQPHLAYLTSGASIPPPVGRPRSNCLPRSLTWHGGRVSWRFGRICRIRALRSPEDAPPATRAVQEPLFQLWLQLPRNTRRGQNNCSI